MSQINCSFLKLRLSRAFYHSHRKSSRGRRLRAICSFVAPEGSSCGRESHQSFLGAFPLEGGHRPRALEDTLPCFLGSRDLCFSLLDYEGCTPTGDSRKKVFFLDLTNQYCQGSEMVSWVLSDAPCPSPSRTQATQRAGSLYPNDMRSRGSAALTSPANTSLSRDLGTSSLSQALMGANHRG